MEKIIIAIPGGFRRESEQFAGAVSGPWEVLANRCAASRLLAYSGDEADSPPAVPVGGGSDENGVFFRMNDLRYEVPVEVVARQVGEETVILHLDTGTYFGLNPVGSDMWNLLAEGKSMNQAFTELLEIYEVPAERLESDLQSLITDLEGKGLLIAVAP